MSNYKTAFQLAQDKGYKFQFEWDNPYCHTYKHLDDWKAIDESIIENNQNLALSELTLIQKWLRDDKGISVAITDQYVTQDYFVRVGRLFAQNSDYKYLFPSYESALLEGVHTALKLIP